MFWPCMPAENELLDGSLGTIFLYPTLCRFLIAIH